MACLLRFDVRHYGPEIAAEHMDDPDVGDRLTAVSTQLVERPALLIRQIQVGDQLDCVPDERIASVELVSVEEGVDDCPKGSSFSGSSSPRRVTLPATSFKRNW